jgi:hypothetical protein
LGHDSPLPLQAVEIPYLEYKAPPVEQAQPIVSEAEDSSWLDRIGQSLEPLALEDEQKAPDWAKDWTEKETPMPMTIDNEPTSAENAEPIRESEPEVPDWLLQVQRESTVPDTEEEPPDWLADLSEDVTAEGDLGLSEGELPGWLEELAPEQAEEPALETAEQSTLQGDLPDWLLELSQEQETETSAMPVRAPEEEPPAEPPIQEPAVQARVEPEKSTRPLSVSPDVEPSVQTEHEETEPEWFSELREEAESATVREPATEESLTAVAATPVQDSLPARTEDESLSDLAVAEMPDWLRELEAEISHLEGPDLEAPSVTPEVPVVLASAPTDETVEIEPVVSDVQAGAEQPDWLAESKEAGVEAAPEAVLAQADEDEDLDWLYELEDEDEEEDEEALLPTFARDEEEQEIEWEDDLEEDLEPMSDDELPEWLQELRAEPGFAQLRVSDTEVAELVPDKEADLEPMAEDELPEWLQELRPADEAQPAEAAAPAAEAAPEPVAEPPAPEAEQIAEPTPDLADEMEELEWLRELEQTAGVEAPVAAVETPSVEQEPAAPSPVAQAPEPELAAPEPAIARDKAPEAAPEPAEEPALPEAQDTESRLSLARANLAARALDGSAQAYEQLVKDPDLAAELVEELEQAVAEHSKHHALQRVLGDAYMRTGQLDKALAAYRQALNKL